jgi:hypothetical protein
MVAALDARVAAKGDAPTRARVKGKLSDAANSANAIVAVELMDARDKCWTTREQ